MIRLQNTLFLDVLVLVCYFESPVYLTDINYDSSVMTQTYIEFKHN